MLLCVGQGGAPTVSPTLTQLSGCAASAATLCGTLLAPQPPHRTHPQTRPRSDRLKVFGNSTDPINNGGTGS